MASSVLLFSTLLASITPALAQSSSVVSLLLPLADQQPIVGSVISAQPSATTYFIQCPPGEDPTDCGLGSGMTVINGPSTVAWTLTAGDGVDEIQCIKPSPDLLTCTQIGSTLGLAPTTTDAEISSLANLTMPVTLTAGLAALTAAPDATTTNPANAGVSGTVKAGSMPRATQNAVLVAAVMGGAALVL